MRQYERLQLQLSAVRRTNPDRANRPRPRRYQMQALLYRDSVWDPKELVLRDRLGTLVEEYPAVRPGVSP